MRLFGLLYFLSFYAVISTAYFIFLLLRPPPRSTLFPYTTLFRSGYCLGGALQLALACDIRVSTPDCQLGLPAIKESLIPGLGTWRLPKYIGWGRAKRMILGGENIPGEEALAIGLVDHVAPAESFFSHVDAIAGRYVPACSTGTRMSKLLTSRAFELDYDAFFQPYLELQERAFTSADASEAKRAYLAKEDPVWK